eukprot:TRINITY_DN10730_c0_g1_i3.p2 TRINITY_DN10730_c0_g1~~TRINITY_DN10730_c0_g1_i3.p2  ORF type:complete len:128 (+),score=6.16 TRINITY_DN10730_c0_g1_i3:36-419(+)
MKGVEPTKSIKIQLITMGSVPKLPSLLGILTGVFVMACNVILFFPSAGDVIILNIIKSLALKIFGSMEVFKIVILVDVIHVGEAMFAYYTCFNRKMPIQQTFQWILLCYIFGGFSLYDLISETSKQS